MPFHHTQTAPKSVILLVVASFVPLGAMLHLLPEREEALVRVLAAACGLLVLACLAVFSRLTVSVDEARLAWWFGFGVPRRSVPLSEIERVERTRTTLLDGWGIHWTRRGWLYNVAGTDAVWVRLRGGKQFLLGTDRPDELVRSIEAARRGTPAA